MYRRYSQRNDDSLSLTQMKRNRIKDIVILLLAAAVIAMAVFMIPAIREQNEERETYIRRFQVEAEEASRQTNSLSRTAGADSASILARIRSNIYAVKKLNEHYSSQHGAPLLADPDLQEMVNMIDRYLAALTTGITTGTYQTDLQATIDQLVEVLGTLE